MYANVYSMGSDRERERGRERERDRESSEHKAASCLYRDSGYLYV